MKREYNGWVKNHDMAKLTYLQKCTKSAPNKVTKTQTSPHPLFVALGVNVNVFIKSDDINLTVSFTMSCFVRHCAEFVSKIS